MIKKNSLIIKIILKNWFIIKFIIVSFGLICIGMSIINSSISISLLKKQTGLEQKQNTISIEESNNSFSQTKKNILNRNIFNSSGNLPPEEILDDSSGTIKNFDLVSCSDSEEKLPFELIGILFTGNPRTNLAVFKDSNVETSDVYKEGQNIINNNSYQVFKIPSSNSVELRNKNKKICIYTSKITKSLNKRINNSNKEQEIELNSEFVSQQIGPGFSKILNSAHLVPESVDGKTIGFKIYGISAGSLFEKIRLENGDVITNVNGVNLEDPSQGFKIYEELQDESEITLQIKRAGEQMTIKVVVR